MSADALATLGATASTGMVLTPESQNIPSPTSEELRVFEKEPQKYVILYSIAQF